jgi:hypothetical protein
MVHDVFLDLMICYFMICISMGAIDYFVECVGIRPIEGVDGINGPSWTPYRVRGWNFMV